VSFEIFYQNANYRRHKRLLFNYLLRKAVISAQLTASGKRILDVGSGIAPMIRKLCKETGFKLAQIYEMFPSGPAKGACKVAGLPKPTGCV